MSCTTSALAGRLYGVNLVCRTWEQPRSSYYVARQAQGQPVRSFPAGKRGPNAALLELIRADLNTSPFRGDGHRKVEARLWVRDGVKVGCREVLRLMRENYLPSPYRGRRGNSRLHEGEIITQKPNLMWGTDGARVFTVEEGWGWIFVAVEHWNAECVGWHVCKQGTRFAALEPISQGLMSTVGSVRQTPAGACLCGWTTAPSICRIIFRTNRDTGALTPASLLMNNPGPMGWQNALSGPLKSRSSIGRVFQNLQEVREAVKRFVDT